MNEKDFDEKLPYSKIRAIRLDKKREKVRKAQLELLEEKGFVTISDVQRKLGDISLSSISSFFIHNKEDWDLKKIGSGKDYAYVKKDREDVQPFIPEEINHEFLERRSRITKVIKATFQIIEEKGYLTTADVSHRIKDIPPHTTAQFIRHNFKDWGLDREVRGGQWIYFEDKEKLPSSIPEKIPEKIEDTFKIPPIIERTPKRIERTGYRMSPTKAYRLLQEGLDPRDAKKVYSSAERYCNSFCDVPSNLNPMLRCVNKCDIWKVKHEALKFID